MKSMLTIFLLVFLLGCAGPSITHKTTITEPSGKITITETKVVAPKGATEPATLRVEAPPPNHPKQLSVSTGAGQGIDQALQSLSKSANWLGAGVILVGLASIVARQFFFPVISMTASVFIIFAGAGIYFIPILADRYSLYIFLLSGLGLAGYMWFWGMKDNDSKEKMEPKKKGKMI